MRSSQKPVPGPSATSVAILLFALFFSSATLAFVGNVSLKVEDLREAPQALEEAMQLTASWTDANGVLHTITTTQRSGESEADFRARHNAAVAAQMEAFPPA